MICRPLIGTTCDQAKAPGCCRDLCSGRSGANREFLDSGKRTAISLVNQGGTPDFGRATAGHGTAYKR
jgi:hypothetical protein